jgi:hypothetical protein
LIFEGRESVIVESSDEDVFDQVVHGFPAAPMGEGDRGDLNHA